MANTSVLIIGGAGYFGARLAEALDTDRAVTVTYRSKPAARTAWLDSSVLQALPYDSARDAALPLLNKFETVINLAMPGARETTTDPHAAKARALKTIDATLALLEAGKAERVVHFSTFHVYGTSGAPNYHEDTLLCPIHPYGETHAMVEERISTHPCRDRVVVLRPTNMVGAPAHFDLGGQAGLIFLDLCQQAASGKMRLRNDGKSFRDILAFPDAISAVRLAAATPSMGGRTMNLAAGEPIRLDALAQSIASCTLNPVAIEFGDGGDAFRVPFHVSVDRLRGDGWSPENDLSPEIKRTLAFFK
jgi:nucleoside-diphosphate-sugar epimerase